MHRISPDRAWPLHDLQSTRQLEARATAAAGPHTLMQRAGQATARLALAVAPHARRVWIACGPGNNGGDGLEAAIHLQQWGKQPVVRWLGNTEQLPADAAASLRRARDAGVTFADQPPPLKADDLAIDALLGLGSARAAQGQLAQCIQTLDASAAPVLAVDLPTGLHADTGQACGPVVRAQHTLSLLTLKPGLFTGRGRDLAGQVWFDPLQTSEHIPATAHLIGPPSGHVRLHASHKGSYGDVAVLGGGPGMRGAALLAASSALHAGAGRVFVAMLDVNAVELSANTPELMWRAPQALDLPHSTVVCGCGGGAAVAPWLPRVLDESKQLVLDADALNAIAADPSLQQRLQRRPQPTVLTPHPLEAARLLDCTTDAVQADRLAAAHALATRYNAVCILKGSGTVVAATGQTPAINPTGNARLATAGTGDVLAGLVAARLAAGHSAWDAACQAAYRHGVRADQWPNGRPLTAAALAASWT
jgi:hydroxyethylthiazole kinase-like uncharacterized protein yjeF